jgi:hypothetical protein
VIVVPSPPKWERELRVSSRDGGQARGFHFLGEWGRRQVIHDGELTATIKREWSQLYTFIACKQCARRTADHNIITRLSSVCLCPTHHRMRAGASNLIIATMFIPTVGACTQVGTGSARAPTEDWIVRASYGVLQMCAVRTHHHTLPRTHATRWTGKLPSMCRDIPTVWIHPGQAA